MTRDRYKRTGCARKLRAWNVTVVVARTVCQQGQLVPEHTRHVRHEPLRLPSPTTASRRTSRTTWSRAGHLLSASHVANGSLRILEPVLFLYMMLAFYSRQGPRARPPTWPSHSKTWRSCSSGRENPPANYVPQGRRAVLDAGVPLGKAPVSWVGARTRRPRGINAPSALKRRPPPPRTANPHEVTARQYLRWDPSGHRKGLSAAGRRRHAFKLEEGLRSKPHGEGQGG